MTWSECHGQSGFWVAYRWDMIAEMQTSIGKSDSDKEDLRRVHECRRSIPSDYRHPQGLCQAEAHTFRSAVG